ncbi:decaprenyl-diphosphate synthase subunit 1 [Babesia caballi]|uniref:Decaprenyl-diphosphate synthase subunit 1 n=1 Tax=Babesia caballi TaxID=5871 RepID=A0AAV4LSI1_BABCB|nr:decaprenyl-diphosphate synthase subunit 1 [Babesia caballi]
MRCRCLHERDVTHQPLPDGANVSQQRREVGDEAGAVVVGNHVLRPKSPRRGGGNAGHGVELDVQLEMARSTVEAGELQLVVSELHQAGERLAHGSDEGFQEEAGLVKGQLVALGVCGVPQPAVEVFELDGEGVPGPFHREESRNAQRLHVMHLQLRQEPAALGNEPPGEHRRGHLGDEAVGVLGRADPEVGGPGGFLRGGHVVARRFVVYYNGVARPVVVRNQVEEPDEAGVPGERRRQQKVCGAEDETVEHLADKLRYCDGQRDLDAAYGLGAVGPLGRAFELEEQPVPSFRGPDVGVAEFGAAGEDVRHLQGHALERPQEPVEIVVGVHEPRPVVCDEPIVHLHDGRVYVHDAAGALFVGKCYVQRLGTCDHNLLEGFEVCPEQETEDSQIQVGARGFFKAGPVFGGTVLCVQQFVPQQAFGDGAVVEAPGFGEGSPELAEVDCLRRVCQGSHVD